MELIPKTKLHNMRILAVQSLYMQEMNPESRALDVVKMRDNVKADEAFLKALLEGAKQFQPQIDETLQSSLSGAWKLDRLHSVVRAILRVGIFELMQKHYSLVSVINDYLEITREMSDEQEVGFVNAVLHKAALLYRPDESKSKA